MTVVADHRVVTVHDVSLVHGSTGDVIRAVTAVPEAWPYGLYVRSAHGHVIVSRREGVEATLTHLDIAVTDARLRAQLALPDPEDDQRAGTVRVPLTGDVIVMPVGASDRTVTVVLSREGTGAPSSGRTVRVRPTSGTAVTLNEDPGVPGTYAAGPRTWGPSFIDADLRIGSTTVRKVSPDFTRSETRIHAVDPT